MIPLTPEQARQRWDGGKGVCVVLDDGSDVLVNDRDELERWIKQGNQLIKD